MTKSSNTIKAIETKYNGYRFRSRTEARWAVYFDYLNIKYEYEVEGFDLGKLGWYLPDFWLPELGVWAEVKGTNFVDSEFLKLLAVVKGRAKEAKKALLLVGVPACLPCYMIQMVSRNKYVVEPRLVVHNGCFQDVVKASRKARSERFRSQPSFIATGYTYHDELKDKGICPCHECATPVNVTQFQQFSFSQPVAVN